MNVPYFTWATIKSFLRQVASIAGLVVSIGNQAHLPTSVRAALASISGVLLTVDHYVEKVTPATTTVTTNSPTTTVNPTTSTGGAS